MWLYIYRRSRPCLPLWLNGAERSVTESRDRHLVTIRKLDPHGTLVATYEGEIIEHSDERIVVAARWTMGDLDLGYVVLEQNDLFIEYYYPGEWYNIFEISGEAETLKGWYCNVTRPVEVDDGVIVWRDLALDLFIDAEGQVAVLDKDEFEALGLERLAPEDYRKAGEALDFLLGLAEPLRISDWLHQRCR